MCILLATFYDNNKVVFTMKILQTECLNVNWWDSKNKSDNIRDKSEKKTK